MTTLLTTPTLYHYKRGDEVFYTEHDQTVNKGIILSITGDSARIKTPTGKKRDRPLASITPGNQASAQRKEAPKFTVEERFDFLKQTVKMVGTRVNPSCVISGNGGMGKTFSVKEALAELDLSEHKDYMSVKGHSTSKGVFELFKAHPDHLYVFDDCDPVLTEAESVLKAALDSYDSRVITWSNGEGVERVDFTGNVIFITNIPSYKLDPALRTRSYVVDISMTDDEKLYRMEQILPGLCKEVPVELKLEALAFIKEYRYSIKDLSLRSLYQTINCAKAHPNTWRRLALYFLT